MLEVRVLVFLIFIPVLFGADNKTIKVGFIYSGVISDFGWNYGHDQGRVFLQNTFPDIQTYYYEQVAEEIEIVEKWAKKYVVDGYDLVVGTSWGHQFGINSTATWAEENGYSTKFLSVSGYVRRSNVATAFAKIYQARYLTGVLAGQMTKTKEMCYIAAFAEVSEVTYGINAFAIGVYEYAPDTIIHVYYVDSWLDVAKEEYATHLCFREHPNVDMVTQHTDDINIQAVSKRYGSMSIGYDSDMRVLVGESVLSSNMFHFGPLYVKIVERILNNTWQNASDDLWGIEDGMVDLAPFSLRVPLDVRRIVNSRRTEIIEGKRDVFCGPLVEDGRFGIPVNGCLTIPDILRMSKTVDMVKIYGSIVIPPPKEYYIKWDEPISVFFLMLTSIFLLFNVIIIALTIIKREHPLIKGISITFCLLMQISGIIGASSIFFWIGKPTEQSCNIRVWLISVAFIIFYGCLLAKSWRVWKLFSQARKLKRKKPLTDQHLLIFVAVLLVIELILLIVFTSISPLVPVNVPNPLIEDGVDVVCSSQWSSLYAALLIAYKAILSLSGSIIAFLTRNVDRKFRESREMYWTLYTIFIINLILLPLMFFLNLTPLVRFALAAVDILWILFFSFSVLFAYRLYLAFTREESEFANNRGGRITNTNNTTVTDKSRTET